MDLQVKLPPAGETRRNTDALDMWLCGKTLYKEGKVNLHKLKILKWVRSNRPTKYVRKVRLVAGLLEN